LRPEYKALAFVLARRNQQILSKQEQESSTPACKRGLFLFVCEGIAEPLRADEESTSFYDEK
jgi:sulfatase maturation enzyme AslB (radical SAM superfamily)